MGEKSALGCLEALCGKGLRLGEMGEIFICSPWYSVFREIKKAPGSFIYKGSGALHRRLALFILIRIWILLCGNGAGGQEEAVHGGSGFLILGGHGVGVGPQRDGGI